MKRKELILFTSIMGVFLLFSSLVFAGPNAEGQKAAKKEALENILKVAEDETIKQKIRDYLDSLQESPELPVGEEFKDKVLEEAKEALG